MSLEFSASLRERKKTATRERIYRVALDLFRRKGFAATTVGEITGVAEVAKGTFFNYFPTKEAVLNYLGERQALATADEIRAVLNEPDRPAREKLRFVLSHLAANLETERELVRLAVFEAMKAPDVLAASPYRSLLKNAVIRLLTEGQGRREVRASLDPELVGSVVAGMYMHQVFEWCAAPVPYALGQRLDAMLEVLWEGMGEAGNVGQDAWGVKRET